MKAKGTIKHGAHDWSWRTEQCEDDAEQFAVLVVHPGNMKEECVGYCWVEDDPEVYVQDYAETECA